MTGESFFPTLAQVTTAVVGFIVAITMVKYSIKKDRKIRRITEFRGLIEEFYQSYVFPFDRIQSYIYRNNDEIIEYAHRRYGIDNLTKDLSTDDFQEHPSPVQFYFLNLYISSHTLSELKPGRSDLPDKSVIENIGEAAIEIHSLLQDEDSSRSIYQALSKSSETSDDFMNRSIFKEPNYFDETEINSLADVDDVVSGVIHDYFKMRDRFQSVYSSIGRETYDILNLSLYLVFVGVFFPLITMVTPPEFFQYSLSANIVFLLQLILLSGSFILTFSLVDLVTASMKSDLDQQKIEEPKWITRKLTQYLPSII